VKSIIDEWDTVEIPTPPGVDRVELDPGSTALLVLDIQNQNCNEERRPRCVRSLPGVVDLLGRARGAGAPVVFSLTSSADRNDIRVEVRPMDGEPVVRSGVDKFHGTELEEILLAAGVDTAIITGTSAHGAVLHTATGAALRGLNVIVPVDCISSSDPYAEQYTVWHLANGPGSRRRVTLTTSDGIIFVKQNPRKHNNRQDYPMHS